MKFKTKFNLNDKSWYMTDNEPKEVCISAIKLFYVGTNQSTVMYNARDIVNSSSWLDHTDLHENSLFKSKADLLKFVFGDTPPCKGRRCSAIEGYGHSVECIADHDNCHDTKGE